MCMKQAPYKIAFVVGSFAGGGTEHYLVRMLAHIDRERYEPYVVTLSDTGLSFEKSLSNSSGDEASLISLNIALEI